jgi:hypothetical protein
VTDVTFAAVALLSAIPIIIAIHPPVKGRQFLPAFGGGGGLIFTLRIIIIEQAAKTMGTVLIFQASTHCRFLGPTCSLLALIFGIRAILIIIAESFL